MLWLCKRWWKWPHRCPLPAFAYLPSRVEVISPSLNRSRPCNLLWPVDHRQTSHSWGWAKCLWTEARPLMLFWGALCLPHEQAQAGLPAVERPLGRGPRHPSQQPCPDWQAANSQTRGPAASQPACWPQMHTWAQQRPVVPAQSRTAQTTHRTVSRINGGCAKQLSLGVVCYTAQAM